MLLKLLEPLASLHVPNSNRSVVRPCQQPSVLDISLVIKDEVSGHAVDPTFVALVNFALARVQVESSDLRLTRATEEPVLVNVQRLYRRVRS